ncbi:hypothetical protein CUMW_178380 [Citrus unshiu]|uniref:Uncharacterized protein n=1 Tax=Citrus unshiu TaxID=55188 RepID=A0A2H5PY81_CITUN|nr:hypothetical protein CUMW_178380 [Citrus unshiu]
MGNRFWNWLQTRNLQDYLISQDLGTHSKLYYQQHGFFCRMTQMVIGYVWTHYLAKVVLNLGSLQNSHEGRITCLGLSADGSALCTGSWDTNLKDILIQELITVMKLKVCQYISVDAQFDSLQNNAGVIQSKLARFGLLEDTGGCSESLGSERLVNLLLNLRFWLTSFCCFLLP